MHGSAINVIINEYPEHYWQPWKFKTTQKNWWTDLVKLFDEGDPVVFHLVQDYALDLATKYGVSHDSMWNTIQLSSTERNQTAFFGGLHSLLSRLRTFQVYKQTRSSKLIGTPFGVNYQGILLTTVREQIHTHIGKVG